MRFWTSGERGECEEAEPVQRRGASSPRHTSQIGHKKGRGTTAETERVRAREQKREEAWMRLASLENKRHQDQLAPQRPPPHKKPTVADRVNATHTQDDRAPTYNRLQHNLLHTGAHGGGVAHRQHQITSLDNETGQRGPQRRQRRLSRCLATTLRPCAAAVLMGEGRRRKQSPHSRHVRENSTVKLSEKSFEKRSSDLPEIRKARSRLPRGEEAPSPTPRGPRAPELCPSSRTADSMAVLEGILAHRYRRGR